MSSPRLSRRSFNRYLGVAGLASPFLSLLRASAAEAAAPIKRLIIMATPNGTVMDEFFPDASGNYKRILQPLNSLKGKLQILRGFDVKSAAKPPIPKDHWPDNINMLTARQGTGTGINHAAGISIDQLVANALVGKTRFKSIHLGLRSSGSFNSRISFSGASAPVAPQDNPFTAWNDYFAGLTTPGPSQPTQAQMLLRERKSILDAVRGDLAALRCELGSAERPHLDRHVESLRELERNMDFVSMPPAASCAAPVQGNRIDLNQRANFPKYVQLQADLIAAAVSCDLSRVFTLQFTWGSDNELHPWVGINNGHHDIAHGNISGMSETQRREQLTTIDRWYCEQFAYLLGKLDAIQEGEGTALDHSAVVWIHEQSNASSHARSDMPYVLAGSAAGYFKTGRQLHFGGAPHARLLSTLATSVGVPTQRFGDEDFDSSPLPSLSS